MTKPKLVRVPTVADLAELGLAAPVESNKAGKPTRWKIKKKGYAAIHAAEAHNALIWKAAEAVVQEARDHLEAAYSARRKLHAKREKLQR